MFEYGLFIDNKWKKSTSGLVLEVEDPSTREMIGTAARGCSEDVDAAVRAAAAAFDHWSNLTPEVRAKYLRRLGDTIESRREEFCDIITAEIGMPRSYVYDYHVASAAIQAREFADIAETYEYETHHGSYILTHEPYGVAAGITPWNYPLTQVTSKLLPAIAAGNTTVLKPSRNAPFSSLKLAECFIDAGFPAGVFNVVTGVGGEVGNALASHPGIQAISFTGSTNAGIDVGRRALGTVKKVTLELGGKSPAVVLPDADMREAVRSVCQDVFMNSGQTCCALTRMIIPRSHSDEIRRLLIEETGRYTVGDPRDPDTMIGPVVSRSAYDKVRSYIEAGIAEGAELISGELPPEEPAGGYYVRPAVFMGVTNDMKIAREEIFGPVLSVIEYDTIEQALSIANDTEYGLAGAVYGEDDEALRICRRLKAGWIKLNGRDPGESPFGGYKMSGIGREGGTAGFEEFLQIKTIGI